jgi:predicted DCC family thiol-disulfide oxidoreductase YuxK
MSSPSSAPQKQPAALLISAPTGKFSRPGWTPLVVIACTALLGLLASQWIINPLITAMYEGRSLSFLNSLIKDHTDPLEYYLHGANVRFSKALFLFLLLELAAMAALWRRQTADLLRKFFATPGPALNLAIFRIVIFAQLLSPDLLRDARSYAALPADLRVPPWGFAWAVHVLPFNVEVATWCAVLMMICAGLAVLGLWTRVSAAVCALLAIYVYGVPQIFGKVNHDHHMIWFAAILALSPCADYLSADAIFKSWRSADSGITAPPAPSVRYSLPLRFVWLLIGVLYFFPGFWKLWSLGLDWATTDNLRNHLYLKWAELQWVPAFRIDHHPWMYHASGLGTLAFETSFIFLVFFPVLRPAVVISGILFHNMTNMFMQISFMSVQLAYTSFVNWQAAFAKLGAKLFPRQMYVLYDGNCGLCRRTVATLRRLDLLDRIEYVNALDEGQLAAAGVSHLDRGSLLRDMHAVAGDRVWKGFEAYRAIAWRFPIFWPVLPFLYLWPVAWAGTAIYRRTADSRTCALPQSAPPETRGKLKPAAAWPVWVLGSALLGGNVYCGLTQHVAAWPIACYPLFAERVGTVSRDLSVWAEGLDGRFLQVKPLPWMSSERLRGLMDSILKNGDPEEQKAKLLTSWRMLEQAQPELRGSTQVYFYRDSNSIIPEMKAANPLKRELLLKLRLRNAAAAATAPWQQARSADIAISGPLHVSRRNPRYLADASGNPVYLTGAHTWNNLRELGPSNQPLVPFDYKAYLDNMASHNQNFMRMWAGEMMKAHYSDSGEVVTEPFPWVRTGPGAALDGRPRFDLAQFNESYFQRLRNRVQQAGRRGIYVSIMLFEGYGVQLSDEPWKWKGHPFHPANNINGIDGDANGDGIGTDIDTLANPAVTKIQEAYVRKVIDAVNDLDNVLFEICNEAGPYSTEWQYHMIRFVREYEAGKTKQHAIGMTYQHKGGSNATLFASPADWVSPGTDEYRTPAPNDGRKVIILDTDHLWGIGGDVAWVWSSFLSGMNPIYMDDMKQDSSRESVRRALGVTWQFSRILDMASAIPAPESCSSGYCLATGKSQYLVYVPQPRKGVTLNLPPEMDRVSYQWIEPDTGEIVEHGTQPAGRSITLEASFPGAAVLYIHPLQAN